MTETAAIRPGIRHVVLVGLMGAGKTTVGERLAARLGWTWRDSDAEIELATGRTVRQLRDEEGVDPMHAREADQPLAALASDEPAVIGAAASVVDVEACRAALAAPGIVVAWLRVGSETLAARFGSRGHRPAYGDDPAMFLADQAARREPVFRDLAAVIVDASDQAPDEVVARVLASLG